MPPLGGDRTRASPGHLTHSMSTQTVCEEDRLFRTTPHTLIPVRSRHTHAEGGRAPCRSRTCPSGLPHPLRPSLKWEAHVRFPHPREHHRRRACAMQPCLRPRAEPPPEARGSLRRPCHPRDCHRRPWTRQRHHQTSSRPGRCRRSCHLGWWSEAPQKQQVVLPNHVLPNAAVLPLRWRSPAAHRRLRTLVLLRP